jgi:hypothetical protein
VFSFIYRAHASTSQKAQHTIASKVEGEEWRWNRYAPTGGTNRRFAKLAGKSEFQEASGAKTLAFSGAQRRIAFKAVGRRV